MKHSTVLFLAAIGIIGLASIISPPNAVAQRDQGLTARDALELVAERFGAERTEWILEMRGYEGIPEPDEWTIKVWDPQGRYLVREYWAGEGEATDEGNSNDFYPERSPLGFVRVTDLKLDSKAAFVIAEGEARKAKMGFDSLNYVLRCREFSREPVWTLELLDAEEELAGNIYISGSTGEVLRTVWVYRGSRGRPSGGPLIVDSSAPRDGGTDASSGARSESATGEGSQPDGGTTLKKVTPDEPDPLSPTTPPSSSPQPPLPPATSGGTDTRIPPPPIPPVP